MATKLEDMSLKQLQQLQLQVKKAKALLLLRSRAGLRQRGTASNRGFRIAERLQRAGGKRRATAAKYANPQNPAETWSGRGRKPRWLAAKLKGGEKIGKFLIK